MNKIILAKQEYDVPELPFGKLRLLIGSINRMQAVGAKTDAGMAEVPQLFGLLIGKTAEEVDALPISLSEMQTALEQIPEICGLVQRSAASGEALAATDGTASTATS
jgi:hypothetical protein